MAEQQKRPVGRPPKTATPDTSTSDEPLSDIDPDEAQRVIDSLNDDSDVGVVEVGDRALPANPASFARLPVNFVPDSEAYGAPGTPEPYAEGYIPPDPRTVGPSQPAPRQALPYVAEELPVGQYQSQGGALIPEPQPLRPQAPEHVSAGMLAQFPGPAPVSAPQSPLAPMPRDAVRCVACGSTVGVFYRDQYTGTTRHQGCQPGTSRLPGQQPGPARETPTIPDEAHRRAREFTVNDAKAGMLQPEDI